MANEIAILVINRALDSNSPSARLVAAELLCRNATRLTATQSLHWPAVLDGVWRPEFGNRTKLLLSKALILSLDRCTSKEFAQGNVMVTIDDLGLTPFGGGAR